MALTEVIVDFGSSFITIFEGGILLKEPSVAIVKEGKNGLELIACGNQCEAHITLKDGEAFVCPIQAGAVKNQQVATLMMANFLARAVPKKFLSSYRIYAIVSSGITAHERRCVEQVFHQAGYRDVVLMESVLTMLPYADKKGSAVAIFGGGTLEVGIVSEKGIVSACSLNLAGQNLTEEIRRHMLDLAHISITTERAEALKLELASLYPNDVKSAETVGRDTLDATLKSVMVRADYLFPFINEMYGKMFMTIESLLTAVLDEKTLEIVKRGLILAGGGSKIRGLEDSIANALKLPSHVIDAPDTAVVRGAAKLLKNSAFRDVIVK